MTAILVPVDFSECAHLLVDEALAFARAFDAELLLLHACEPPRGLPLDAIVRPPDQREAVTVREWLHRDTAVRLAPLEAHARASGTPVRVRVVDGGAAETILAAAAEDGVRLVVMGTHGRTGLARVALGSIAQEVVRHATVPVVTVRTRHRPECAAGTCASCASGVTDVDRALAAERDG